MTCHPSLCSPSSLASQRELRKRAGSLDPYGLNDAEDVQVPSPLLSFQLIKYTLHGRSSSSRNSRSTAASLTRMFYIVQLFCLFFQG